MPTKPKVLLVDDNQDEILLTRRSLEKKNFEVVSVTSVTEAFKQIAEQSFDVLITDLHMPEAGDGFAVVAAMRHTQPDVLVLVVSDFPDMQRAMSAVLLQADEILMKPCEADQVVDLLQKKMLEPKSSPKQVKESVASILEHDATTIIGRWLSRLEQVEELISLPLTSDERTAHLPDIIKNIATRLRKTRVIEAIANPSKAAVAHGQLRYRQGYSAPLIVQESRILQVCIFEDIQRNLSSVNFSFVLPDVMLIADEVDSQLSQTIASFLTMKEAAAGASA
jgi:ActR/RegA family two-component response regulator